MRNGPLLRAVAAGSLLAVALFAMGPTGTIVGTVTDASGGVRILDTPTFGEVLTENAYGNKPPRQIQLSFKYVF